MNYLKIIHSIKITPLSCCLLALLLCVKGKLWNIICIKLIGFLQVNFPAKKQEPCKNWNCLLLVVRWWHYIQCLSWVTKFLGLIAILTLLVVWKLLLSAFFWQCRCQGKAAVEKGIWKGIMITKTKGYLFYNRWIMP